ncbi:hypothetical protein [Cellulomonas wangsupingiae]|uniref:hypothetical protein n=1 Tax=Cellulomonas wangsupingiae TaxID=2968085 RepID=UPI001D0ED645|nr:hypothetical protein [Cellulomonas wangsupingiae]MCM0640639.1 hypothetical protein [Cellulomonas wangsupingiae]
MRTIRGTAPTILLVALLAGCAGSTGSTGSTGPGEGTATPSPTTSATADAVPSVAETTFPGAPEGVTEGETAVVAGDDPRHLQVVTYGSSTCPVLPTDVTWDAGAGALSITLTGPGATDVCTMDLAPTTSVVALPDGAPDAPGLTVEVDGRSIVVE